MRGRAGREMEGENNRRQNEATHQPREERERGGENRGGKEANNPPSLQWWRCRPGSSEGKGEHWTAACGIICGISSCSSPTHLTKSSFFPPSRVAKCKLITIYTISAPTAPRPRPFTFSDAILHDYERAPRRNYTYLTAIRGMLTQWRILYRKGKQTVSLFRRST